MKSCKNKISFTLLETIVVIAITTILIAMVVAIASSVNNQSKEQLTRGVLEMLDAALEEFADYSYRYKVPSDASGAERDFYHTLDFPIDCNGLEYTALENELAFVMGYSFGSGYVIIFPFNGHKNKYSGSEGLYYFLYQVPTSRETLQKINKDFLTNEGSDSQPMELVIGVAGSGYEITYPLMRIVDPWGTVLRYDCYMEWKDYKKRIGNNQDAYFRYIKKNKRTFPLITSAGPDRKFGTDDDITNR